MSGIRWTAAAFAVLLLSASPLAAQPSLTTIQDTLYKADGSRFDGYAFIEWKSFETSGGVQIPEQSLVVRINGGNLRAQLAPTTNAPRGAYYQVKFNSEGRIQFVEYWSVPPSATALKLSDIRLAGAPTPGSGGSAGASTMVAIADVTGLQDELNARPVKGGSYSSGRTAVISSTGTLNGVGGNLTDCVRVDGSTVPCSTGPLGFVDGETPNGLIDGTNTVFTLTSSPNPVSSLTIFRNGVRQHSGVDYSLSGNTVTFIGPSVPRTGDSLIASYRTGQTGEAPVGAAGGHLAGFYPDPQIAENVISDFNINASAGIAESKLALNFPTHSNVNDPTAAEKAAMSGTSGTPAANNRFVTAQDPRLSDPRTPTTHGLLSTAHGDTSTGTPMRGDLIVGQGSPSLWSRLALGPANRCLVSNGLDAVWNSCLFTGFALGSVPMVDAAGNLTQSDGFVFDPTNRRLSVGNNQSISTGYFYNATPLTGVTTVAVRAGQAQGTSPLSRWLDTTGAEIASISSDGGAKVRGVETRTTNVITGFRDLGNPTDPSNRLNGDMWYNTTQQTRKTIDAGQTHTQPQVVCSSTGGETTGSQRLGSCLIPSFFIDAGDRIEIHFNYEHTGTSSDWNFGVAFGPATLVSKNVDKAETRVAGRADGAIHVNGLVWGVQSYGTSVYNLQSTTASATITPSSALRVEFYGTVLTPGTDTVKLLNFSVVRYPAISNP